MAELSDYRWKHQPSRLKEAEHYRLDVIGDGRVAVRRLWTCHEEEVTPERAVELLAEEVLHLNDLLERSV